MKQYPPFPYLLISSGKYENENYLIQNEEDKNKAGVAVVKSWIANSYFHPYDNIPATLSEFMQKETKLSENEINEIVNNPALKSIQLKLGEYYHSDTPSKIVAALTRSYNTQVNHNKNCDTVKKAVQNNDGAMAWKIIKVYQGGQYQKIEEKPFDVA